MIQRMLTTQQQPPAGMGGFTGGGAGLAGVASTAEGEGIHVINERSKYKEWEFVYDLKNDKSALGLQQQQQLQPGVNPNMPINPNSPGVPPPPPGGRGRIR